MTLTEGVAYLRSRGIKISRASLYRWSAMEVTAGRTPLIHQPTGFRGRAFVVPREVESFIRSRCSTPTADRRIG